MENFVTVFSAIDKDRTNKITKKELETYVQENNLDKNMINTWFGMFDKKKTGIITLEEFCETLSISPATIKAQQSASLNAASGAEVPKEIEVIATSISDDKKKSDIAKQTILLNKKFEGKDLEQKLVGADLKKWLDETYGRAWQVNIVNGSYFLNYSHDPENSFFFKYKKFIYLLWKTPSD